MKQRRLINFLLIEKFIFAKHDLASSVDWKNKKKKKKETCTIVDSHISVDLALRSSRRDRKEINYPTLNPPPTLPPPEIFSRSSSHLNRGCLIGKRTREKIDVFSISIHLNSHVWSLRSSMMLVDRLKDESRIANTEKERKVQNNV